MNDNRDNIQFWNPGDVFGDDSRLFEPGEKEVRNPAIAMAMRRIAMCEQAGTGMLMMREECQKLGHPAPTDKNDRAWKAFDFFIPELDKEVDMASDLMKAMFADCRPRGDVAFRKLTLWSMTTKGESNVKEYSNEEFPFLRAGKQGDPP